MSIQQLEEQRAITYRNQWDQRISFRMNQLRQVTPQAVEFERMWENYRHIYDFTNYINQSEAMGDYNEFFTPFDIDDSGDYSRSEVHLRNAKPSRRTEKRQ